MADFDEISNFLKAISDPTRLRIIDLLLQNEKPLCVNALANKLNVTQSAISQHLRILKQLGLVLGNRKGYHIHYEVKTDKFDYYSSLLNSIIAPHKKNT